MWLTLDIRINRGRTLNDSLEPSKENNCVTVLSLPSLSLTRTCEEQSLLCHFPLISKDSKISKIVPVDSQYLFIYLQHKQ